MVRRFLFNIRENTYLSLIISGTSRFRRRRPKEDPFSPLNVSHVIPVEAEKKEDPRLIVEAFKESEANELGGFKRLRIQNVQVR